MLHRNHLPVALALALATAGCTTPEAQISASGTMGPVDADFVTTAYQIVQLDNQEGALAANKATDPRIKDLSAQVVAQANQLYPSLQSAAKVEGITPPTRPPAEVAAEVERLRGLSGAAFDRQYVADQLAAHQRAVAIFQKEDAGTKDGAMRAEVETLLPVVQDNLTKLQYLSGDLSQQPG